MSINLKPCPFCGGSATIDLGEQGNTTGCSKCGYRLHGDSWKDSRDKWNSRHEAAKASEQPVQRPVTEDDMEHLRSLGMDKTKGKPDELSQYAINRVANAIEHLMRNGVASDMVTPVDHSGYFMPSWFFKAAKVAIEAMPKQEAVDLSFTHEAPWPALGLTERQGMIYENGWNEAMKYARQKLSKTEGK